MPSIARRKRIVAEAVLVTNSAITSVSDKFRTKHLSKRLSGLQGGGLSGVRGNGQRVAFLLDRPTVLAGNNVDVASTHGNPQEKGQEWAILATMDESQVHDLKNRPAHDTVFHGEFNYVDQKDTFDTDFVQLARLALSGAKEDVHLFLRRIAKRHRERHPSLAKDVLELLRHSPTRVSPLRKEGVVAVPVDSDSRFQLLRIEQSPRPEVEPVFAPAVAADLGTLVGERKEFTRLHTAGLDPTRTVLFTGPPGVGKTLAARWLAREIGAPLLILDLSAVMSSFLGRTGNNVRQVIEYAKGMECVLLLDELDAIAKRRDDVTEIGELKRLVTVLLQEIDGWPPEGLIVAATNHPSLLDPAVWRRFERVVTFPMPDTNGLEMAIRRFLASDADSVVGLERALAVGLQGLSYSDVERLVVGARRAAAVDGLPLRDRLVSLLQERVKALSKKDRSELAVQLIANGGISQRDAYEFTGVSRDTIRKAIRAATTLEN